MCSKIIQDEVEATYRKLQKYLGTLIGYKDLWSLNPSRVLQIYKNKARDSVINYETFVYNIGLQRQILVYKFVYKLYIK